MQGAGIRKLLSTIIAVVILSSIFLFYYNNNSPKIIVSSLARKTNAQAKEVYYDQKNGIMTLNSIRRQIPLLIKVFASGAFLNAKLIEIR